MTTRKEMRSEALHVLRGKWSDPFLATLVVALISMVAQLGFQLSSFFIMYGRTDVPIQKMMSFSSLGMLLWLLFVLPLTYGFELCFLRFSRGREESVREMFQAGFKEDYGRSLATMLLVNVFVMLWSLLLIIPGIIKWYAYSMTVYIAEDEPQLSAMDCIDKSMAMMKGHKWQLFLLDLSFIGWFLLCLLTFGIGFLWLVPYQRMTRVQFYEQLKAEGQALESV